MENQERYQIIREIGAGGMARVFLARDTLLNREVALKMIHPHLLENPQILKRFQNEANAVAQLSHENIIKLFDYGVREEKQQYLVMEYIQGRTLAAVLGENKKIPNLVLLEIMSQLVSGLSAAHAKGIYHRDVKPSNIMVDTGGTIKIMDFGLVYIVNQGSMTMTGTIVGSPNYLSPEQAENSKVTDKSDIFSVGAVMYECATGRCPFAGENVHATMYAILNDDPLQAYRRNPKLLSTTNSLIMSCLNKDPALRPAAAGILAQIGSLFNELRLQPTKKRIEQFLNDPAGYTRLEEKELSEQFRIMAREFYKKRKPVDAVKYFSQARQLGELSPADLIIISRIKRNKLFSKFGIVAILFLCFATGIYYLAINWNNMVNLKTTASLTKTNISPATGLKSSIKKDSQHVLKTISYDTASLAGLPDKNDRGFAGKHIENGSKIFKDTKKDVREKENGVKQSKGYFKIKTNPPYTSIYINDDYIGIYPQISLIPLNPGKQHISLKNERCKDYEDTIVISSGDTLYKEIVLSRLNN